MHDPDECSREGTANYIRIERVTLCVASKFYGQATKGVCVDALAEVGDEGRGQLR